MIITPKIQKPKSKLRSPVLGEYDYHPKNSETEIVECIVSPIPTQRNLASSIECLSSLEMSPTEGARLPFINL
jgi:hypothetical protein